MAKGSAMGLWKGKKGSSVFYRIWNSNNKEVQGIREYRAEIKNPQSNGQADQRAKLLPIQLVKGALRDVLSRSFQGVPYGGKSLLEFRRLAMRQTSGYPYLTRGTTEPVPGAYLVSKGSLGDVNMKYDSGEPAFVSEFLVTGAVDDIGTATVGSVSTILLNYNGGQLQDGDQITFVACLRNTSPVGFRWEWYSFYVDTSDTRTIEDTYTGALQLVKLQSSYLGITALQDNVCAAATIISREGDGNLHLRSTSRIALAPVLDSYFTPSAGLATRASYQDAGQGETDWPVDDDTRADGGSIDGLYTLSGLTGNLATLNGRQVRVKMNASNAPVRVYVNTTQEEGAEYLVDDSNGLLSYSDAEGGVYFLSKSQVPALANLPSLSV